MKVFMNLLPGLLLCCAIFRAVSMFTPIQIAVYDYIPQRMNMTTGDFFQSMQQ